MADNDNPRADLLSNIVSPLDAMGLDPDQVRANPSLLYKKIAEMYPSPVSGIAGAGNGSAPTVPATVTTSGMAKTTPTLADQNRMAIEGQMRNIQGAEKAQSEIPLTDTKAAELEAQRAAHATPIPSRDAQGNVLPEYKPTTGQRIVRGLKGFGEGLAKGGIGGAIAGTIDPRLTTGKGYGDPNKSYDVAEGKRQAEETSLDQQIAQQRAAFKESLDRLSGRTKEQRETAKGYADISKSATDQEKEDTDRYKAEHPASESKIPTTPEGMVVKAATEKFPDDPDKQLDYVRKNGIVSPDTAARIAEAKQRLAEIAANAADRKDERASNRANQAFQRYQTELLRYGDSKGRLDDQAQKEWRQFQDDFDNEYYGKQDSSSGERTGGVAAEKESNDDKQRVVNKYATRRQQLQDSINSRYAALKEPKPPAELNSSSTAPSPATDKSTKAAKTKDYGPAPKGATEGRKGVIQDGGRAIPVIVRKGRVVPQ